MWVLAAGGPHLFASPATTTVPDVPEVPGVPEVPEVSPEELTVNVTTLSKTRREKTSAAGMCRLCFV